MQRRWARTSRATLVLVAALVASSLAACSGDDGDASSTATTARGAATAAAPGGTTATGATTAEGEQSATTVAGQGGLAAPPADGTVAGLCPALAAVPAGAAGLDSDRGDFDGDRALDSVTAYKQGAQWKLRVGLSTGGGAEVDVTGVTGEAGLTPLGGANLGGGPGAEVFTVTGQGAATATVGVFSLDGCTLTRVLGPSSQPAEFAVGGTVVHGSGLRCQQTGDQVHLLVLEATSPDGTTFTATSRPLVLQDGHLIDAGAATTTTLTAPDDNGDLGEFFRITCGGVAEGS